jgi:hypothetical protein
MQPYATVTAYVVGARNQLQDLVAPYRYTDDLIVGALNQAMVEVSRIRPDIFLDLKYNQSLKKGDLGDGMPAVYTTASDMDAGYDTTKGTVVPIPGKYIEPVRWYVAGFLQLYDVTDTQDQRAQAFLQKFNTQMLTLTAA